MDIRPLAGVPFEVLHRASNAAYADYVEPVDFSPAQLRYLLRRRGYRADLSLGAFDGEELVGFVFNGSGDWNGRPTAYDTGTAVLPAWRRQGVSTRLFEALLPLLRERGIRQYLLEVIKSNTGAVDLYRKSGFTVTREFDYWVADAGQLALAPGPLPDGFSIAPVDDPGWDRLSAFWDFEPSWQNSVDSLMRVAGHIVTLGVYHDGGIVAYGCMEKETGDLPQLAVQQPFRRLGLATALLARLLEELEPTALRLINTCAADQGTRRFLLGLGIEPGPGQYEMILPLQ